MPQKLGVYDVYGTLGKGAFTRVRFAVNKTTNFTYAMKIIDKKKLRQEGMLERMKNEIAIMKMIDCKYCVGVRDLFSSAEKIFLVVDIMMGGSLYHRLRKRGRLSEETARYYIYQLGRGIEYCHDLGIVNGGLSLEGVLLDGEGGLKISNFDWAMFYQRDNGDETTSQAVRQQRETINEGMKSGSPFNRYPQYFSPERVNNPAAITPKSDIWALGVMLYALVAGYLPFDSNRGISDLLDDISELRIRPYPDHFSEELKSLLNGIFVADPVKRYSLTDVKMSDWVQADGGSVGGEAFHKEISDEEDKGEDVAMPAPLGLYWTLNSVNDFFANLCVPMASMDANFGGTVDKPPHVPQYPSRGESDSITMESLCEQPDETSSSGQNASFQPDAVDEFFEDDEVMIPVAVSPNVATIPPGQPNGIGGDEERNSTPPVSKRNSTKLSPVREHDYESDDDYGEIVSGATSPVAKILKEGSV